MGSRDRPISIDTQEEVVDLDADTKESTDEVFCNEETEETPHKIYLLYDPNTPKPIIKRFPVNVIIKQVGSDVTLGRHESSDVLLYEKHMARWFASVTCRTSTANKTSFVLRNTCKGTAAKRIAVTDARGRVSDVLPTQEVELVDQGRFRLEGVEFTIGIELGDMNSKTFMLEVKPLNAGPSEAVDIGGHVNGIEGVPGAFGEIPNLDTPQFGLSVSGQSHVIYPPDQITPKAVASQPLGSCPGQVVGVGHGIGVGHAVGAGVGHGIGAGVAHAVGAGVDHGASAGVASHLYQTVPKYYNGPAMTCHCSNSFGHSAIPQSRLVYSPSVATQPMVNHQPHTPHQDQLLERGSGCQPSPSFSTHPCQHQGQTYQQPGSGMTMTALANALANTHVAHPAVQSPITAIVTTPSSHDQSPVLYPSPTYQGFRFPQAQPMQMNQLNQNGDLRNLPRGPPLGHLHQSVNLHSTGPSSGQSVNLHSRGQSRSQSVHLHQAGIPANVVTTHAVAEVGGTQGRFSDLNNTTHREPKEHEEKSK
ncbi:uncharacterized protein LOC124133989 [Haliotis rufescens]|uniref:uncharacterized protein LOC124133989 n=1 Tax=Haliotis rufescens TaxID=6454 RepID=UPI00201F9D59|nr:uncharacterized protein LOC124133989 [Haliotis rufescens]XP_046354556.2 uncharacterized protein LOC124133989 [Haliotis rufescens]